MTIQNNKKKRRVIAFGLAGVVLATCTVAGVTFANLNQTITDGSDSQHVYSEQFDKFGFSYHSASQKFDTNITPTDDMSFKRDIKNIIFQNDGDIKAQWMFRNVDVPELDPNNPIWDETYVIVHVPVLGGTDDWAGTMREYLNTAFVTNHILGPDEAVAVTVEILSPTTYTWSSEASAEAVDINFGTQLTFNQLTHPTLSPLWDYASQHGEQRGGMLKPEMNSNFNSQLQSKMVTLFTLPVSEVDKIIL